MSVKLDNGSNKKETEIVELMDDKVNKYQPGIQVFKFVSLTGLQNNSRVVESEGINLDFLLNKDVSPFQAKNISINRSAVIRLQLPKDVARKYGPEKFIPIGTRFIVSFKSGDLTKPVIIGGLFEDELKQTS